MASSPGFVLVVSLQPTGATTTLFFGQLLRVAPESIRVVEYGRDDLAGPLAAASAVVIVRGLFEFRDVTACAMALRIPVYYFLDDNFMLLREQIGHEAAYLAPYSTDDVRNGLRDFAGVLLATQALVRFFSDNRLHPRLFLFPPMVGNDGFSPPPAPPPGLRVAFFGGSHLHAIFLQVVVPAVRRLAREHQVTLVAVGIEQVVEPSPGLSVVQPPYDESYARGLATLASWGVDVIVHPVASDLSNNLYKNPHALITAHLLGAVPITSNSPPYSGLDAEGVVLLCDDAEDSWYQALVQASTNISLRSAIRTRLADYCAAVFGGVLNREVWDRILREQMPPDRRWRLLRRSGARVCLWMRLVDRAKSRLRRSTGASVAAR